MVIVAFVCSLRVFTIPSGSDIPTLMVGDYILCWRFGYGASAASFSLPAKISRGRFFAREPQRGDMAVFLLPKDEAITFVKRVIGMPGDRVQMRDGRLYINGTTVPREPDGTFLMKDEFDRDKQVPKYIETLPNGVKYDIVEMSGDEGYYDNTDEYVVPPGHYFTLGDNRDNSDDSRDLGTVGYVPADNFIAKPWRVLFSTETTDQRLFKAIQ